MKGASILRWLLVMLIAIATAGCASGPAPRDHFYRLQADPPTALTSPRLRGTLEVGRLRVESVLRKRGLLYRDGSRPEEIRRHSYHLWVDPPSIMVQDQLAAYLRAARVAEAVVTPAVHVDSDYLVSGRIVHLESLLEGGAARVLVELELTVMRKEGRELLVAETYREERVASGETVADSVRVYKRAITAVFERFVADLPSS